MSDKNERVFQMNTEKVIQLLVQKAERKGKTKQEVYIIINWLTGYPIEELDSVFLSKSTYKQFFDDAPHYNSNAEKISGSICGVKVQEIEEPTMKRIRQLDKLIDELAKGKSMEKILRK